jgi:putative phage-type endonuclease
LQGEKTKRRKDWLKSRCIGGSDIAAIMGLSPFDGTTPWDAYMRFWGEIEPRSQASWSTHGKYHEPAILRQYKAEVLPRGHTCEKAAPVTHPKYPYWTASADSLLAVKGDPQAIVEVKEIGWRMKDKWADGVPVYYLVQVYWYMMAYGIHRAVVVADIDRKLEVFPIEYDPKTAAAIEATAVDWWENHIVPRVPPPIEWGTDAAERYLRKNYPSVVGEKRVDIANDSEFELLRKVASLTKQADEIKAGLVIAKQQLADTVGSRYGLEATDGHHHLRVTYGDERQTSTSYAKALEEFQGAVVLEEEAEKALRKALAAHTKTGSTRKLKFSIKESKDG